MQNHTIASVREAFTSGEKSAVDIVTSYLDCIAEQDRTINAFITVDQDYALAQAKKLDEKLAAGEPLGRLAGVPIALKDNLSTAGLRTTCASKILENYQPIFNAHVVEQLIAEDAVIIGKTNMDEFAMGATTETSYFGPTLNPLDTGHVPGGSSGGSAAAIAADMVPVALGSDTGGSIRQPAAYCGIYGLKPTYGVVSRYGCVAFGSSLDQIGPMGHSVADLATTLSVIAGHDHRDANSLPEERPDYEAALQTDMKGKRIGIPEEMLNAATNPAIRDAVMEAADIYRHLGAEVETCHLAYLEESIPTYYLIATAEASSNLARFDGVRYGLRVDGKDVISMFKETRREGFGEEVKRRIMLGTYALSAGYYDAFYLKALKVRRLIQDAFKDLFKTYDALLTPTAIQVAPALHENLDAVEAYRQDLLTCPVNLAGLPGLSMPFGQLNGLPIGLQLIGNVRGDETLIGFAAALERYMTEVSA